MQVARALAVSHTCMYNAWSAYDHIADPTIPGIVSRRPAGEHTVDRKTAAIGHAAYRALVDLFPTQQALLDGVMLGLGLNPGDASLDPSTPVGIGNLSCAAVLARRHNDGANQLGNMTPSGVPYADYTGYMPVNSPSVLADPNRWQPLLNPDGTTQRFATPHWSLVTPFALTSASQFRPDDPALYPDHRYDRQARQLIAFSANLGDVEKAIATYWADGPATETPPGHWNLLSQWVSRRDGNDLDDDVKLFFALNNAELDASIAAWDCKTAYDYVRPISAIRFLFAGQTIQAWGGPGLGTRAIDGATWRPYIPTPAFAEYTSGHSTFSAAAAEILRQFTRSDHFGASVTITRGSSFVEPGVAPVHDVVLSWETFRDAADEAGISRRYGGIHFQDGDLEARRGGRLIGRQVWQKARKHFNGQIN